MPSVMSLMCASRYGASPPAVPHEAGVRWIGREDCRYSRHWLWYGRNAIGLQAYGQKDPLVEYKMSAYEMFDAMSAAIQEDTLKLLYHVSMEQKVEREEVAKVTGTNKDDSVQNAPQKREEKKIYPNDPCPCGSGKKYKQCCGRKK